MLPDEQPISFDEVVAEELKALKAEGAPLTALCISGGGIRSATFGLGVLQGLADQGVLGEFDYLSTVSGGGYIGGWLTAWKQRAGGLDKILPKLRTGGPAPEPGEIDPIGYLREYNNYLSPRLGFLSADTWTLGTTVILNMALNWLVIVPLLLFALMMPRLILSLGLLRDLHQALIPAYLALPLRIAASGLFTLSIVNAMRYLPSVGRRNR